MVANTVQQPNFFSRALSGFNNWMQQNPEKFAIMADTVGSSVNPNNPFAGVGTSLAKSSLAAKEEQRRKTKQDSIMKLLSSLAPAGEQGANSLTFKMGPNGLELTSKAILDTSSFSKLGGIETEQPQQLQQPQLLESPDQNLDSMSLMERLHQRALGGR